ncbi:MAG: hypothetical protein WCC21_11895 [Candidatus Acidiferrales bacterium]
MLSVTRGVTKCGWLRWLLLALAIAPAAFAQQAQTPAEEQAQGPQVGQVDPNAPDGFLPAVTGVPIFSMGVGMITAWQGGQPNLEPLISPVGLIPIGQKWLIEGRGTFESDLVPDPNGPGWKGSLEKEADYIQVDYIANKYVTFSFGRYLTPFGIFNERLYPIWIRNLQSDPLILPISTGPSGAGTGAMLRGGFNVTPKAELNYVTYFSTKLTTSPFDSDRDWGMRAGMYLPGPRFEFGGSFQHLLQAGHSNAFGFHFAWQPPPLPLDIRAEYARSRNGSGYWVEGAYRLSQVTVGRDEFRHVQVVGRMQEYDVGKFEDEGDDLPVVNTKLFEFGLNYYFRDDLRFVSSYGRQFAAGGGNANLWTVGVTYRLAVPVGNGDPR